VRNGAVRREMKVFAEWEVHDVQWKKKSADLRFLLLIFFLFANFVVGTILVWNNLRGDKESGAAGGGDEAGVGLLIVRS